MKSCLSFNHKEKRLKTTSGSRLSIIVQHLCFNIKKEQKIQQLHKIPACSSHEMGLLYDMMLLQRSIPHFERYNIKF